MLSKNEQRFLDRYEKPLQKPAWNFVLRFGLSWALIVLIITTVYEVFLLDQQPFWKDGRSLLIRLLIMTLAGIAYGFVLRRIIAKRYHQIIERRK